MAPVERLFFVPFTAGYLALRWARRYIKLDDLLGLVLAGAASALAVAAYTTYPKTTVVLGLAYVVCAVWRYVLVIQSRAAKDQVQGEVVSGLFRQISRQLFHDDPRIRFTLFYQCPFRRRWLVPWYRHKPGGLDPIKDASESRACFRRGEGAAGQAWESAGTESFFELLEASKPREAFEQDQVEKLRVAPRVAAQLSDYMRSVHAIFTYALVDSMQRLLGVVSIDLQMPFELEQGADGRSTIVVKDRDGNRKYAFDEEVLYLSLASLNSVLVSFASTEKS